MIFGRSIGTGPAIHLASKFPIGLLSLMSAYTSIRDIARHQVSWIGWIVAKHFDNEKKMASVNSPTFFVHG
jgi:hypothetical protein